MRRMLMIVPALLFFLLLSLTGYASSMFISCGVPGAKVLVDSRETATTDTNGEVYIDNIASGTHVVSIVKDGYVTYTESVAVKDKLTSFVAATLKRQDTTPPEIMVLSPSSSRGIKTVVREDAVEIVGLARDDSPIAAITVNGLTASLARPGSDEMQQFQGANVVKFRARVALAAGDNAVSIEALDNAGNRGALQQTIERQAQSLAAAVGMDCRALLIGVDDYQNWPDLRNPVHDITTLADDLKTNYGFKTEVLANPTKKVIVNTIMSYYNKTFPENSELLIVLAGHGYFDDEKTKIGYFVGSDGLKVEDDTIFDSYISYPNLNSIIANIPCQHILLVIDACFGGTFDYRVAMRGGEDMVRDITKEEFIFRKLKYKTRLLLASGGKEFVPDRSNFMYQFFEGLRKFGGPDGVLTIEELMANYMQYVDPEPQLLDFRGNEPGSSVFFIAQ